MCCRTEYLGQTLDSLSSLSGLDKVTVYVSQDGHDIAVGDLVQQYGQGSLAPPRTSFFDHWQRDRVPQLGPNQARHAKLAPAILLTPGPALPCPDAFSAHITALSAQT